MDIQSIVIFQIIADVALCIAVLFLLLRIGRNITTSHCAVTDNQYLSEFQKLLVESQNDTARLFRKLDESIAKFQDLAMSLEQKEERLKRLVHELREQFDKAERIGGIGSNQSTEQRQKHIMSLLSEGLSLEEIAKRFHVTTGEVGLIVNLENKKKELTNYKKDLHSP